jgi:hypothetical protein
MDADRARRKAERKQPMIAALLTLGALVAFVAVVLGWLFRRTSAPLWIRIVAPAIAVAAGCYAPWSVNALLGYPVSVAERDLPDNAELVAFVPHDETGAVVLWLLLPSGQDPRAYATKLTPSLKEAMREAQEAMAHGAVGRLKRVSSKPGGASQRGDAYGISDDDAHWTLLVESPLPAKE